jgi:hypothetical protein
MNPDELGCRPEMCQAQTLERPTATPSSRRLFKVSPVAAQRASHSGSDSESVPCFAWCSACAGAFVAHPL